MEIKLISPRGFCKGVTRAFSLLDEQLGKGKDVYVLHSIVHNKFLLDRYKKQGVIFVDDLNQVPKDAVLVVAPHGIDRKLFHECEKFNYVDTTCPFVFKIHKQVREFLANGIPTVLIGKQGHSEALGIVGQRLENDPDVYILSNIEDVKKLPKYPEIGCVIQTTLSQAKYMPLLDALQEKYSSVLLQNTICDATEKRQKAVIETEFNVLLVVGDTSSSNANELLKIGQKKGNSFMIINDNDVVAITAAASASEEIVEQVYKYLKDLYE